MPAAPSATSVRPLRQGRPIVSRHDHRDVERRTARAGPARSAAGRRVRVLRAAAPAGSCPHWRRRCRPTAITKPWWVCTIRVGPRRATGRAVSAASSSSRAASRSGPSAGTSTRRPSAFDTILLVTTRTSPSRSHGAAVAISAARSSPGRRPRRCPRTGRTSSRSADRRQLHAASAAHHRRRRRPRRSSTAAAARTVTPGTAVAASARSTSQPSSRPPSARAP